MSSSQQASAQSQASESQASESQASESQASKSRLDSWLYKFLVKEIDRQKDEQNEKEKVPVVESRETESKIIDLSQTDSVVSSVVQSFLQRAEFGLKKYGKTMDRDDLTMLQWIQHAQEEHMDAILYLEKLKQLEITRSKK